MKILRSIVCGLTAVSFVSTVSAAETVPAKLEAKRSGITTFATPAPQNLIYTRITPCRVFSKKITADAEVSFQITGNGSLTGQGGPAFGCGIPASAKAVSITLSTLKPAISGSLTGYASGSTRPGVASSRFNKGLSEATGTVIDLSSTGKLALYPSETVSAIGDVVGYFEPQLWAYVGLAGNLLDSSGRVTSSSKAGTGTYSVVFDRDITSCSGVASSDLTGYIVSVYTSGSTATVYIDNNAGTAADYYFNLQVMC